VQINHAIAAVVVLLTSMTMPALAADSTSALPAGLDMIRRSERAFARATAEIGVRNGFLMFFADDAITPPDTAPARQGFLAVPAPVEFRPTDLAWEPLFGDIARSGDLGYLTGPSSFTDRSGKKHMGVYFSVWSRNPGGCGGLPALARSGCAHAPRRPASDSRKYCHRVVSEDAAGDDDWSSTAGRNVHRR
jgi:hypothetical protein